MQLRRQTVRVDGVRQQKLVVRVVVLSNVCIGGEDDACLGPAAIRLDHEAVGVEVVRVSETARQHQSSARPSLRLQCQQCTRHVVLIMTGKGSDICGPKPVTFCCTLVLLLRVYTTTQLRRDDRVDGFIV